jgi:hypothetical protein
VAYKRKNTEECKILWFGKGEIAVDFKGCGYIIKTNKQIDKKEKNIIVTFENEGTKDFKLFI